ncbi:MAG: bifunctional nuclease family protein [Candidatus Aenigmarchaeota archaeon]|nr:bifunctional nuclease family protein [Candidatus Aenigmarchaeota archaeon]
MQYVYTIIAVIIAIAAGVAIGYTMKPQIAEVIESNEIPVELNGFVPLDIDIQGTNVRLSDDCKLIAFDVTEDQALSISKALNKTSPPRPLAHDIFADLIEQFEIKLLVAKIDRFDDGIYYARMIFQFRNSVLEVDARPSDTIAISLRAGVPLHIDEGILNTQGTKIC